MPVLLQTPKIQTILALWQSSANVSGKQEYVDSCVQNKHHNQTQWYWILHDIAKNSPNKIAHGLLLIEQYSKIWVVDCDRNVINVNSRILYYPFQVQYNTTLSNLVNEEYQVSLYTWFRTLQNQPKTSHSRVSLTWRHWELGQRSWQVE